MAKYRISCLECSWHTKPHYLLSDCVKEKGWAHSMGKIKPPDKTAHDAAFKDYCPKCGGKTSEDYGWFE